MPKKERTSFMSSISIYKQSKSNFEIFILVLFKFSLDLVYSLIQHKLFGFYGFSFDFSFIRLFLGWICYLVCIWGIPKNSSELSDIFIYTILMLSITPCIVYYQYNKDAEFWMILVQVISFFLIVWILSLPFSVSFRISLKKISYKNCLLRISVTTLLLLFFVYLLYKNGIPSFHSVTFSNISKVRALYSSDLLLNLLYTLVCKIVIPIYILIAIKERRPLVFFFSILLPVYIYAITGFKSYLFIPVIIIGTAFFSHLDLKMCIIYLLPCIILFVGFEYLVLEEPMLYSLINERVFFLPAKIKIAYFDFFSKNEFAFFSQSTIGKIFRIPSIYEENIPNMIGRIYWNRPKMWTNTGFMADAYSNLGFLGMVIISVFVSMILKLAQNQMVGLTSNMKKNLEALFLIFFISLNDGGTISVIFSGGLFLLILVIVLIDFTD